MKDTKSLHPDLHAILPERYRAFPENLPIAVRWASMEIIFVSVYNNQLNSKKVSVFINIKAQIVGSTNNCTVILMQPEQLVSAFRSWYNELNGHEHTTNPLWQVYTFVNIKAQKIAQ